MATRTLQEGRTALAYMATGGDEAYQQGPTVRLRAQPEGERSMRNHLSTMLDRRDLDPLLGFLRRTLLHRKIVLPRLGGNEGQSLASNPGSNLSA